MELEERMERRENAKERLAGELLQIPLAREIERLRAECAYVEGQHNQITVAHEGPLRVALFAFHKGNVLQEHRTAGPISVQMLSGRVVFTTETGGRVEMGEGCMLTLAGGIAHSVEALEDAVMLLTVVQTGPPAKQPEV